MRSLRRPARPVEQAVAAARVRGLLREGPVGWVPPPLEEPAVAPSEPEEDDAPAPGGWATAPSLPRGRHAAPGEPWAVPLLGGREPRGPDADPAGWAAGSVSRADQGPGRPPAPSVQCSAAPSSPGPPPSLAAPLDPAPSVPAPFVPSPWLPDDDPAAGTAGLAREPGAAPPPPSLVERLRAGRLDPGRPGVVGLTIVGLLACLVAGVLVLRSAPEEVALPTVEQAGQAIEGASVPGPPAPATTPAGGEVVVAVAGKVRRPGVVRLVAGSRVDDAVRAAGGLQPGATTGLLNLARLVVDGEQVLVGVEPPPGAAAPVDATGPAGAGPPAQGALVDLNTATVADLDRLPGIGPVLAERILEHRTRRGPFRSVDQLREVSGIGEAKFTSLRDAVTV